MPPPARPLLARLAETARAAPERTAFIQSGERLGYGELIQRVAGACAALQAAGVAPGDRVLISASNSVAIPIVYFAAHAAGAVAVLASPETPPTALYSIAERAGVRLAAVDRAIDLSCPVADIEELAACSSAFALPEIDLDAPADLLFTTGTTGKKKGVLLTHRNAMAAGRNISEFLQVRPDDIQAVPLPLSHSFGLGCIRSLAWIGHCVMIEKGLVNPAGVLKRMDREAATALALVPSGLDLVRRLTGDKIGAFHDRLRFIELGSAPISKDLQKWLMEQLPTTRLCHHFGMTEASRAAFIEYHADSEKLDTVGRPSPNVSITILGTSGEPAPIGEEGEIAIAGDVVLSGYWDDEELTAHRLGPYGLATGDLGRMDAHGYLHLLGRRDDIINVGGRKVTPDEVEELLRAHPAIADAVCTAALDPVLGQVVQASIVVCEEVGDELIVEWLKPQIEDFKLPRIIRRISSVPRTSSGKVQRQLIKAGEWR